MREYIPFSPGETELAREYLFGPDLDGLNATPNEIADLEQVLSEYDDRTDSELAVWIANMDDDQFAQLEQEYLAEEGSPEAGGYGLANEADPIDRALRRASSPTTSPVRWASRLTGRAASRGDVRVITVRVLRTEVVAEVSTPLRGGEAVRSSGGAGPGVVRVPPGEAARIVADRHGVHGETAPRGYLDGGAPARPGTGLMMPRAG